MDLIIFICITEENAIILGNIYIYNLEKILFTFTIIGVGDYGHCRYLIKVYV